MTTYFYHSYRASGKIWTYSSKEKEFENFIHFENFSFCVEFVLNAELKLWGQHYHNLFLLGITLMQNANNFLSIHVSVFLLY